MMAIEAIASLKSELIERGEAGELFGNEPGRHLQGILGNIDQTFDGQELYPSIEVKSGPPPLFRHQGPSIQRWQ